MIDFLHIVLFVILLLLVAAVFLLFRSNSFLKQRIEDLIFRSNSQSVKYGKLTEQFIPFVEDFPFSSQNFRFLGSPIDGVVFEEDKIIFAEFKTASSQLSKKQKNIKQLVKDKKVEWFEYHLR